MRLSTIVMLLLALSPGAALAQVETREGIALQNQILQLRQEVEALRRGGALPAPVASPFASPGSSRALAGPQGELVPQLLDRVSRMEEEQRQLRGRAEQAEFNERQLRERVQKLEGDIDFRLQAIEQQRNGGRAPAPAAPNATPAPPPATPAAAGPRPPQRALAEGQAALARREFVAAEAAAREVINSRDTPRQADAQMLLGDSLLGRRDFGAAAVAYDDAFRRSPQGSRAPEAMLGVANSFIGMNNNRDACGQLTDLRTRNPNLAGPIVERVADARRRAQCR